MRIGITGATGFIGQYLIRHLLAEQTSLVRALVRSRDTAPGGPTLETLRGDLESREICSEFVQGLDVIYHLAHRNTPIDSDCDQASDTVMNLLPTLNLIRAIRESGSRAHFVYLSTGGAIYRATESRTPFRESDSPCPTSSYGIQKLAAENYLRLEAERGRLTATVLRVGNAFGTVLPIDRSQGLIGVATAAAWAGRPVQIFGNTSNVRDYIHLRDISRMAWLARNPKQPFTVVNVGSGVGHSVREVLELFRENFEGRLEIQFNPGKGECLTDWVVLDVAKALREFGWVPEVDLRSGIREVLRSKGRDAQQPSLPQVTAGGGA